MLDKDPPERVAQIVLFLHNLSVGDLEEKVLFLERYGQ